MIDVYLLTILITFICIINRVLFVTLTNNEKLFIIMTDRSVFLPNHYICYLSFFIPITNSFLSMYTIKLLKSNVWKTPRKLKIHEYVIQLSNFSILIQFFKCFPSAMNFLIILSFRKKKSMKKTLFLLLTPF